MDSAGWRLPGPEGPSSIMAIEDSPTELKVLGHMLASAGYEVRPYLDAERALVDAKSSPPDMVLTDILMPGIDGYEVCRRLRETCPGVPVIIISVTSDPRERVRGLTLGAVDFLTKPVVAEELVARVRTHLALCRTRRELQGQTLALKRVNDELRDQVVERLRVEEALRLSEDRYRRLFREEATAYEGLFANVPDGCAVHEIILDQDGQPVDYRFLAVNAAFERLTGLRAEEVIGRTALEVFKSPDETMVREFGLVVLSGESLLVERRTKDDRTFRIQAYRSCPGRFVTLFSDLTQQKLMEARLAESRTLSVIGRLAGGVAHDFNNQLTATMGYADLLVTRLADPSLRRFAECVVTASRRMADLTQKLLAFAQQGQYRRETLHVRTLVEDTVHLLQQSLDKRVRIEQCNGAESDVVVGDPSQLQNVLLYLAFNAYDAMPEGGTLTFETSTQRFRRADEVPLAYLFPGTFVVVKVCDTGRGMSDEVKAHVFEPFFTTKQRETGTGMGLPAAYGTVLHHGGGIAVESELGRGTTITVYLPHAVTREEVVPGGSPLVQGKPGYCVLVVDDEEIVRELVGEILAGVGHRVLTAADGEEALQLFRQHRGLIDLVVLDMMMPRMDGRATYGALKTLDPNVKVLLASGYTAERVEQELGGEGVLGFVQKPFQKASLLAGIQEVMGA